jgi:hypothetical protein
MYDIARYNWGLSNKIDTIRLREYKDSFPIVLLSNLLNTFKIAKILLILIFKIQYWYYLHSAKSCCLRIPPWIAVKPHFAHTIAVKPRCNRGRSEVQPLANRGSPEVKPMSNLGWPAVKLISRQYCICHISKNFFTPNTSCTNSFLIDMRT